MANGANIANGANGANTANQTSTANQEDSKQLYCISSFLRVASPIASFNSGLYHTPRVADEVIVSYLDEDIDKPYVSANLYNLLNKSLVPLPQNDHQT
ncbi:phage baseplate assembly protein V, partial [Campylobacter troglodytis]|uniref:phage baseplate assembly protein V n=1 Tax=Campylobacter troglodytis TaxID=654363 RepID=UPI0031F3793A